MKRCRHCKKRLIGRSKKATVCLACLKLNNRRSSKKSKDRYSLKNMDSLKLAWLGENDNPTFAKKRYAPPKFMGAIKLGKSKHPKKTCNSLVCMRWVCQDARREKI